MNITEKFLQPTLPQGFYWYNEPARYVCGQGLELWTKPETDFWQRSHYGFRRDDGHCLFLDVKGDFCVSTHVEWTPKTQYDQCGLMIRVDSENWIKTSTEYENEQFGRLGSVVTNLGYSDWATQDISSDHTVMWYRISRRGQDFKIEASFDGEVWKQLRIAHLHKVSNIIAAGMYACSPIGADFQSRFIHFTCGPNTWSAEE
jgi:regulation of enolase protein 1 (concanavalin A-like superfamily)